MANGTYARLASLAVVLAFASPLAAQTKPKLDVPFVPTPQETVDRMLDMGGVSKDDYLIDLGSGDGRIVITAAKRFGTRGFGVDIDPERIAESRTNARDAGVADLVEFRNANLFETDISQATVLTMYLLPDVNLQLRPRILSELRPGTRVVSHRFTLGDWKPDQTTNGPNGANQVHAWVVPAKVDGSWTAQIALPEGARTYRLELDQKYQEIGGRFVHGEKAVRLENARLVGDRIGFSAFGEVNGRPMPLHMTGRVHGDSISGIVRTETDSGPAELPWQATRTSR